jgi:hypothetical protein
MQVLESKRYCNFVNSINSQQTRRQYEYTLGQFLKHYQIELDSFLGLPQQEIFDLVVNYLVNRKISRQYKIVIFSAIKHACEMNDVILNWKILKKFIKSERIEQNHIFQYVPLVYTYKNTRQVDRALLVFELNTNINSGIVDAHIDSSGLSDKFMVYNIPVGEDITLCEKIVNNFMPS